MANVKWTPVALAELEEILFQIAVRDRRPETAGKLYHEIRDFVDLQAEKNIPGHEHSALPGNWLYWMFKRWLIAFERIDGDVIVYRIVDASRDLPGVF